LVLLRKVNIIEIKLNINYFTIFFEKNLFEGKFYVLETPILRLYLENSFNRVGKFLVRFYSN
jgi:hypothetical protein